MLNTREIRENLRKIQEAIKEQEKLIKSIEENIKNIVALDKKYLKDSNDMRGKNVPRSITDSMEKARQLALESNRKNRSDLKKAKTGLESNRKMLKNFFEQERLATKAEQDALRNQQQRQALEQTRAQKQKEVEEKQRQLKQEKEKLDVLRDRQQPVAPIPSQQSIVASLNVEMPQNNGSQLNEAWKSAKNIAQHRDSLDIVKAINEYGIDKYSLQFDAMADVKSSKAIDFVNLETTISFKSPSTATVNQSDDLSLQRLTTMYAAAIKISNKFPENINVTGATPEIQRKLEKMLCEELHKLDIKGVLINGKRLMPDIAPVESRKPINEINVASQEPLVSAHVARP